MNYTKIQKVISTVVITFFLFGLVFRFPFSDFLYKTQAGSTKLHSLVSIIVSEDVYAGVKGSLDQYAEDIGGQLENTRVVIIPTPVDASVFQIASLNENLYYEGYEGVKNTAGFKSKLIGTVLVGNIPVPVVFDNNKAGKTLLPYTDFDEKRFFYNHTNAKYEPNIENQDGGKPEIWHGVISPNTGDSGSDIQAINDFFEKDHSYYEGTGNFEKDKAIINGNIGEEVHENYRPHVFYFDQFREQAGLSYSKFKGYEGYLENKEDLVYSRYSKELADKIKDKVLGTEQDQIQDLLLAVNPDIDLEAVSTGPDVSQTSDITTRHITQNVTKSFLETINSSTLGEFRKDVHNAGRYNEGGKQVNVDSIPYLVSVLDVVGDEIIKGVNNNLEENINDLVLSGLSRNIAVPTEISIKDGGGSGSDGGGSGSDGGDGLLGGVLDDGGEAPAGLACEKKYENILYGMQGRNMTSASDCTIYRGSIANGGTLVEANRGLNIKNVQGDLAICNDGKTQGYWGGNSPVNLDQNSMNAAELQLSTHDITTAIRPIYDITGAKKVEEEELVPSPLHCFENNYIVSYEEGEGLSSFGSEEGESCEPSYQIPINGQTPLGWRCDSINRKYSFEENFEENYKSFSAPAAPAIPLLGAGGCDVKIMQLDGETVQSSGALGGILAGLGGDDESCVPTTTTYSYKKISSQIEHVAPDSNTLSDQINGLITPNLPIDKDRYIDFIGAGGEYAKINYPYLFRISEDMSNLEGLDEKLDAIGSTLDIYLDEKSAEINAVIADNSPEGLTGEDLEIYEYLKSGDYPDIEVDLKEALKSKPLNTLEIDGDEKEISYYDTLVFSIFWNSLKSVDAKYKFIFEHYLSDQFSEEVSFAFPKNKKMYEIAYLGAPGNAQGMLVKLDPELKGENPYADVTSQNLNLASQIFSYGVIGEGGYEVDANINSTEGLFNCAPPEGVPIWEWIPAVMCWLKDMLPPKIHVGQSQCSSETLFADRNDPEKSVSLDEVYDYGQINGSGESGEDAGESQGELLNNSGEGSENGGESGGENPSSQGGENQNNINTQTESGNNESEAGSNQGGGNQQLSCNLDDNGNGISNCLEQELLGADIVLSAVASKLHYGAPISLESYIVDSEGNTIKEVNGLKTYFELDKIEVPLDPSLELSPTNTKVVYDSEKLNENSQREAQKYVLFNNQNTPVMGGKSSKYFHVRNKDALISFKSKVILSDNEKELIKELKSNVFTIEVSGNLLSSSTYELGSQGQILGNGAGVTVSDTLNIFLVDGFKNQVKDISQNISSASLAQEKMAISLYNFSGKGEEAELNYPLRVSIKKGQKQFIEDFVIPESEMILYKGLLSLRESGVYTIQVTDSKGFSHSRKITLLAGTPKNIDIKLGATIIESDGNITSNVLIIEDQFGNIADGKLYSLDFKSTGGGLVFPGNNHEGTSLSSTSVFEGYKAFRLQPTGKQGDNIVTIELSEGGKKLLTENVSIETLSIIDTDLKLPTEPLSVGGNVYSLDLEFRDAEGQLLDDFNSRVYVSINPLYGKVEKKYINVGNGRAEVTLTTGRVAGKDIDLEIKTEGLAGIIKKKIEILPGEAMKVDMILSQNQMGASDDNSSVLTVELKDKYNNLVHNDNSTVFDIELQDEYNNVVGVDELQKTAQDGKAQFELSGTSTPGTAHIKVKTTPDLSQNSFDVGEGDDKITVNGVGENATKIQTHYFWGKDNFDGKRYNSLYSVLLGAPYGDFTQEDYLAGSLLFNKENRSLVVTSLLDTGGSYSDVVNIGGGAGVNSVASKTDLSQDLSLGVSIDDSGAPYIDMYNEALNINVGKIHYNLPSDAQLRTCIGKEKDFSDCNIAQDKTSVVLKSLSSKYSVSSLNGELVLFDSYGEEIFGVSAEGKFNINAIVELEVDDTNSQSFMVFSIVQSGQIIAKIALSFIDQENLVSRTAGGTQAKLENTSNSIVTSLESYQYGTREVKAADGTKTQSIYYNDPLATSSSLNSFAQNNSFGLENFEKQGHIGWADGNKSILSFAAGKGVGESVQEYASFGTVNLGDPVISLKKIKKKFNNSEEEKSFDSSIGNLIARENEGYQVFDYDNDEKEDILLIKKDGYFQLLENKGNGGQFLDKGNVAKIVDLGNIDFVQAGDFTGDGYGDIFFIDNKGDPYILNNNKKDFTRISLKDAFGLSGKVVQVQGFDMDADGKMDVTVLDDSGEISVFYGGGDVASPIFDHVSVGNGYGITLNSDAQNNGAAIYFDGLKQLKAEENIEELRAKALSYSERMQQLEANSNSTGEINEELIDRLLFISLPYLSEEADGEGTINSLPNNITSEELGGTIDTATESMASLLGGNTDNINFSGNNHTSEKTFIRSEYSAVAGVQVKKFFIDRNGGELQGGDIVDVEVKITNISGGDKNNLIFVDAIKTPFVRTKNEVETSDGIIQTAPAGFDISVAEVNLAGGEEVIVSYELKVLPIKFGYINVGLFEKTEAGDDAYGDIMMKPDNKNCSQTVDIFRSIGERSYLQGVAQPQCDDSKLELPEELEKNKIDEDGNGVPDYIDEIVASTSAQQEFAEEKLNSLHSDQDNDGIPDDEDNAPTLNNEQGGDDFLSKLDKINQSVDEIALGVDNLIEGFGCGFGGGSCIATPLNWAPLAAGGDPTLFGVPIGDGLKVNEGVPIFSSFTGRQTSCGNSPCCLPSVWPATSQAYVPGPFCGANSAGGMLGTWSPTNFVRLFATPTLTGGFGIAACYGGPAMVAGNAVPMGVSPVVPGGNCVVYAAPLSSCSNDGSEGDPEVLGLADEFGVLGGGEQVGEGFGIVNANCSAGQQGINSTDYASIGYLNVNFVEDYYNYKNTGGDSSLLYEDYKENLTTLQGNVDSQQYANGAVLSNNRPLFSLNDGGVGGQELSVDLNFSGDRDGNFQDVVQIKQDRVAGFPSFLMDWATRQIEEFVTKLADFPTPFIILPDFHGVIGSTDWEEYFTDEVKSLPEKVNEHKQEDNNRAIELDTKVKQLEFAKSGLDCEGKDEIQCLTLEIQQGKLKAQDNTRIPGASQTYSGIRAVYDFLGNIPLVQVKPQQVNIEIPYIDQATLEKTWVEYGLIADAWSTSGNTGTPLGVSGGVNPDVGAFVSSLRKNREIIKSYNEIPERLSKLLNQKEIRAEQLLCNIDSIGTMTGSWIGFNGKRFKAWVELFILIKAILKSWQLMVDVFIDYDTECHECKNERNDLLNFEFKLIDMIIPDIPVIKFPKWPDIILDFHNVRAGLTIMVPDINITQRPIVLPSLSMPQFDINGNLTVNIPKIPLLPELPEIPELPDIPTLPSVELPNLPPPPTLPKMFASLEGVLNILKLVTKAMCILKSSPFVPEWRSGDQIAFLTERNGYLPTDFLDLSLPEFSFPFVDAIKVTTWVNLEFETEFLTEMVKQIAKPWNSHSSNIVNVFSNAGINELDLGQASESVNIDASINAETGDAQVDLLNFSKLISSGILALFEHIESSKDIEVDSKEFLTLVNRSLSSNVITSNPRMDKVLAVWEEVNSYTYSKENKKIAELQRNNKEKFDALRDILNKELKRTREMKDHISELYKPQKNLFENTAGEKKDHRFVEYNRNLEKYNTKFLLSARDLVNGVVDPEMEEIQAEGENLLSRVSGGLENFKNGMKNGKMSSVKGNILAAETSGGVVASNTALNSCQQAHQSSYRYDYKGLYVIEKEKSYRLFDYIDELQGNESYESIDFDGDEDTDLLYMVNGELFLKENLQIQNKEKYRALPPLYLDIEDNRFFNGEELIEAVNGFKEINTDTRATNIVFQASSNPAVTKYRLEYYTIIDKALNKDNSNYIPENVALNVVDVFVGMESSLGGNESADFTTKKHPASIEYVGGVPGVKLTTPEMINIKNDVAVNNKVILTPGTQLYSALQETKIQYYVGDDEENILSQVVDSKSSIEFRENITIIGINGDAYVEGDNMVELVGGNEINSYVGLPFFSDTKLTVTPDFKDVFNESSHVDLAYANDMESSLDFTEVDSYEVYDLGYDSSDYLIRLDKPNDYYYGRMYALGSEYRGTYSSQELFSPQFEADDLAPELNFYGTIKVPVYQIKTVDLTNSIYDNAGLEGITSVNIDLDLNLDSDGDGDPTNDASSTGVTVSQSPAKVSLDFGPFEELSNKKIGVTLVDENDNVGYKELEFEVYAPNPEIDSQSESQIQGSIDEDLVGEPVNLYRVRGGVVSKLEDTGGNVKVDTFDNGVYNFDVKQDNQKDGLVLSYSGATVAQVNEFTGKVTLEDGGGKVDVVSGDEGYPQIIVRTLGGAEIYHESIKLLDNREIVVTSDFDNITEEGMYMLFENTESFGYYMVPTGTSYNPGALVVYKVSDELKTPIFTLFPDGRILPSSELYKLEYTSIGDYVGFELISRLGNVKVGEVLLQIEASYLMK